MGIIFLNTLIFFSYLIALSLQENNYAELEDESASGNRAKQADKPSIPQQQAQHQIQKQASSQSQSSVGSSSASQSSSKKDKSKKGKDVSCACIFLFVKIY
jgi:hypothetical protein